MRLCTFRHGDAAAAPGIIQDRDVRRIALPDLVTYLSSGGDPPLAETYPLASVTLLAPVPSPPSIRDFYAFEQHVARGGRRVPPFWYDEPVFYFSNPAAVIGPGEPVVAPSGSTMLDYELEVAAVIGTGQRIAGFTVLNDWSARDLQRAESAVGLGPAKGKDFATSMGPVLVTVDEFDGSSALMTATVNGVETSRGSLADMHFGWERLRERAGRDTRLRPGDVLGSGTVGTGCLLERADPRWLVPGDLVELTVSGLGTLSTRVAGRASATAAGSGSGSGSGSGLGDGSARVTGDARERA